MNRTKVKICGLTRSIDIAESVENGADILGFVFANSPRKLEIRVAVRLLDEVPAGITRVGLFMNNERQEISTVLERVPLDILQFHGSESSEFCNSFDMPYIKAIAMGDSGRIQDAVTLYPDAAGHLFDGHQPGGGGGTGVSFDWSLLQKSQVPTWLAGGLNPENVATAIRRVRPYAVDVSSGVEDSPGIKSPKLIKRFMRAVKSV